MYKIVINEKSYPQAPCIARYVINAGRHFDKYIIHFYADDIRKRFPPLHGPRKYLILLTSTFARSFHVNFCTLIFLPHFHLINQHLLKLQYPRQFILNGRFIDPDHLIIQIGDEFERAKVTILNYDSFINHGPLILSCYRVTVDFGDKEDSLGYGF